MTANNMQKRGQAAGCVRITPPSGTLIVWRLATDGFYGVTAKWFFRHDVSFNHMATGETHE